MKATDLIKRITNGEAVLTGKFMGCTIEKTRDGTKEYELTKLAGPTRNLEFKKFGAKGAPVGTLKPRYSFAFGTPVAAIGFGCDVRDGYLQTDCVEIVPVEP